MAKAMVEDGDLFAEGGNVTYDEADLKDGATPEQIEAIDQIKAAVIEMGGRVNYGVSDEDGTLTYMYLVVDEPPTYDAVLKVITKENNEPNLFRKRLQSLKNNKMKELNRFRQFLNEGVEDINIMGQKFNFPRRMPYST